MSDSATLEGISPYLVMGQSDEGGQPIVETARALHDLIVTFPPQGHYSVRTVEDECGPAIHCAFERRLDADQLARLVGAIEVARYDGYRSERAFYVNERLAQHIRRTLERRRAASGGALSFRQRELRAQRHEGGREGATQPQHDRGARHDLAAD